jgi:hypothetical protein
MSLAEKMHVAVLTVQGAVSSGTTPRLVSACEGRRQASCKILQCDSTGVSLKELSLQSDELAAVPIDSLRDSSQALCRRLTYLLEPISPVEADTEKCVVQMRSNPPQVNDNGLRYYELLFERGGAVTLRRYEKFPGNPRKPVSATLTHEVLGQLTKDFSAALDEIVSE